jgi:hypothetical protein
MEEVMADELKPCPFCGGKAELRRMFDQVRCTECYGRGCEYDGHPDDAIAAWNQRTTESALLARAEAAEEKLEKVREWRNDNLDDGCVCSLGYHGLTGRRDPGCEWHRLNTSDLDAILAPGGERQLGVPAKVVPLALVEDIKRIWDKTPYGSSVHAAINRAIDGAT